MKDVIAIEVRDGEPKLSRFRCTECGRIGAWLENPDAAERNGQLHAQTQHVTAEDMALSAAVKTLPRSAR